jgi:hypothetical protein
MIQLNASWTTKKAMSGIGQDAQRKLGNNGGRYRKKCNRHWLTRSGFSARRLAEYNVYGILLY